MKLKNLLLDIGYLDSEASILESDKEIMEKEIEHYRNYTRVPGTGYQGSVYRVVGTDDAIVIETQAPSFYKSNNYSYHLDNGYFARQKDFTKTVGYLSKKYAIPFSVALAIGDNEKAYQLISEAVVNIKQAPFNRIEQQFSIDELSCGIGRRKNEIEAIIGSEASTLISLDTMGQKHSTRIADYLISLLQEKQPVQEQSPLSRFHNNINRDSIVYADTDMKFNCIGDDIFETIDETPNASDSMPIGNNGHEEVSVGDDDFGH